MLTIGTQKSHGVGYGNSHDGTVSTCNHYRPHVVPQLLQKLGYKGL